MASVLAQRLELVRILALPFVAQRGCFQALIKWQFWVSVRLFPHDCLQALQRVHWLAARQAVLSLPSLTLVCRIIMPIPNCVIANVRFRLSATQNPPVSFRPPFRTLATPQIACHFQPALNAPLAVKHQLPTLNLDHQLLIIVGVSGLVPHITSCI